MGWGEEHRPAPGAVPADDLLSWADACRETFDQRPDEDEVELFSAEFLSRLRERPDEP